MTLTLGCRGAAWPGSPRSWPRSRSRPLREDGKHAGPSWPSGRSPPWRSAWPSWGSGISPGTSTRGGSSARSATLFGALTAGFNLLVLLAGALWFCVTLEARIKRKEALGYIQELREFAHVIDVTQLYYTPDLYRSRHGASPGKTAIDETYLLYCTQMLGVISNLAPLYSRGATGDSILRGLGGPNARDGHRHQASGQGRGRAG